LQAYSDWDDYDIPGGNGPGFDRPIAVLVGPTAASMADITLQRLRYHPMVRFFGKSSIASLGDNEDLPGSYPDWSLHYSKSDMFHLYGPWGFLNRAEFPVDEEVWLTSDGVARGEDDVVKRAVTWITTLSYAHHVEMTQPLSDSVRITSRVNDPFHHALTVTAFLQHGTTGSIDSLNLLNDGLNGDGVAGDSIWGGMYRPANDGTLIASIRTRDNTAGTTRSLPSVVRFNFIRGGARISMDTRFVDLGEIPKSGVPFDTSFYVYNRGWATDSLSTAIDPGNLTPDTALVVLPGPFTLAPGDSHKVTFRIRTGLIAPDYFAAQVFVTSAKTPGVNVLGKNYAFQIVTPVGVVDKRLPTAFGLEQNYPNPFNPNSDIRYQIAELSNVRLAVYDVLGREVAVLVNEKKGPGTYQVRFEASTLPSGVYFYRIQVRPSDSVLGRDSRDGAGSYTETKRLLLIR
jgi:hypothetical protein